jgi:hypothetical protein
VSSQDSGQAGRVLRTSDEVVARRLQDEVVLVHMQTNRIYTLNATGARCWELLKEGLQPPEITRRLMEEFDIAQAQLEEELGALLSRLEAEQLVLTS